MAAASLRLAASTWRWAAVEIAAGAGAEAKAEPATVLGAAGARGRGGGGPMDPAAAITAVPAAAPTAAFSLSTSPTLAAMCLVSSWSALAPSPCFWQNSAASSSYVSPMFTSTVPTRPSPISTVIRSSSGAPAPPSPSSLALASARPRRDAEAGAVGGVRAPAAATLECAAIASLSASCLAAESASLASIVCFLALDRGESAGTPPVGVGAPGELTLLPRHCANSASSACSRASSARLRLMRAAIELRSRSSASPMRVAIVPRISVGTTKAESAISAAEAA